MRNILKFTSLIAAILFYSLSSYTDASSQKVNHSAPEATTAESKLPFREVRYLDNAFIDSTPANRNDGLILGELGVDGGNKKKINKLAKEMAKGKHGKFDSFLLVHQGKLLFESYYNRGRIDLPHPQASATKAYTGFAIGRAIQLGYLTMEDLDKPVINFLKDLDRTKLAKGAEKITLHQAMTMRSGIRFTKEQEEALKENPEALKGQGQVQVYLERSAPITTESQTFKYQNDPIFPMQVLEAVVPGTAENFIKHELLGKMGITNYNWRTETSGLPFAGAGSSFTSRDMVKFGLLTKSNGQWKGEQLIPEAFIKRAASRIFLTIGEEIHYGGKDVSNQGYGYYWWSTDLKLGNKSYFSRSAQGGWGQFIVLIDELDLMVVFTAHDNETAYQQIIAERILPAFID